MELTIQHINQKLGGDTAAFIGQCEQNYWQEVCKIAEYIGKHHKTRPVILLSGPSGSGKTTTAHLLEQLLEQNGLQAHTISMDNYFLPLTGRQKEDPELDLESPNRVDKHLLNQQLREFFEGKTVEIPTFNFTTNSREYHGDTLSHANGEVIILEGIHVLNPEVVTLSRDHTVRIYVSVRTRLIADDNSRLHPKWIRLMRRMLRDEVHRGRNPEGTYNMFDSVNRGEERYIMPYKIHSMFDIDTCIPYEIGLYRQPLLEKLETLKDRKGVADMIKFLEQSQPLDRALVPENSLLNEFI